MNETLQSIFRTGPFMPHGHCYLWTPGLLWLHVISDALIVFSYFTIPVTLIYFVRRRHDMRFGWMFVCFAVFIIACGTTHLMEIWNVWHSNYWLAGGVKAITALASVPTAYLLTRLVSPALKMPSMADLEKLNLALEQEVATRTQAEARVRGFNAELEERVHERTVELHEANADLRRQVEERQRAQEGERAARAEAERVSQLKDEFLATLSHELRTPLNAIFGWAQILQGPEIPAQDLALGLDTINRSARAQRQIIDDLLDMSAVISGKLRMNVQRVDLAALVETAVDTLRPAAAAKGIRLQVSLDQHPRPISGDPDRLQQVLWNLLNNAIKFTPKEGQVQVRHEVVNSQLKVTVADSGEGIGPDFLPYVFDRFRQENSSLARRHGGLGLGLSIVKHLVELHGGAVSASSEGSGQGAAFTVTLPLAAVSPEEASPAGDSPHAPLSSDSAAPRPAVRAVLAGVSLVVVDDEPDARILLHRLLAGHGARVRTAGTGDEAIALLVAEPPDVFISDIGLPGETGHELIQRVRALDSAASGVPALALTAYAQPEDRQKAIRAGFQMHLAKPVDAPELLKIVAGLAGRQS